MVFTGATPTVVGVAVGSQELTIVKAGAEPEVVAYNRKGVEQILAAFGEAPKKTVMLCGNRKWAKTLAYALRASVPVHYLSGPERSRGVKIDNVKVLGAALQKGDIGRPFFRVTEQVTKAMDEAAWKAFGEKHKLTAEQLTRIRFHFDQIGHPWLELAALYDLFNDEIRRAKHRILDVLRLVFPELLSLDQKLWTDKRLEMLRSRTWESLGTEAECPFADSLGRSVPEDEQQLGFTKLDEELRTLAELDRQKGEFQERIAEAVGKSAAVSQYNESFTVQMVVALVGWRHWGSDRQGWRQLRGYAGLAVTRMDAKGNPRISRKRPLVRVNLYHALKSSRGKQVIEEAFARRKEAREKLLGVLTSRFGLEALSVAETVINAAQAYRQSFEESTSGSPTIKKMFADSKKKFTEFCNTNLEPWIGRVRHFLETDEKTKDMAAEKREEIIARTREKFPRFVENALDIISKTGMNLVEREEHILRDIWKLLQPATSSMREPALV